MAKPEWGRKRTGPCGTKFYDFNKSPIICPGCGGEVITNEVKTTKNKNEVDKNPNSNSKEQTSIEDRPKDTVLDSGILDDDVINDDVGLDVALDSENEKNISDDEDINLIDNDNDNDINLIDNNNDIVLDVEIDEEEK